MIARRGFLSSAWSLLAGAMATLVPSKSRALEVAATEWHSVLDALPTEQGQYLYLEFVHYRDLSFGTLEELRNSIENGVVTHWKKIDEFYIPSRDERGMAYDAQEAIREAYWERWRKENPSDGRYRRITWRPANEMPQLLGKMEEGRLVLAVIHHSDIETYDVHLLTARQIRNFPDTTHDPHMKLEFWAELPELPVGCSPTDRDILRLTDEAMSKIGA